MYKISELKVKLWNVCLTTLFLFQILKVFTQGSLSHNVQDYSAENIFTILWIKTQDQDQHSPCQLPSTPVSQPQPSHEISQPIVFLFSG